MNDDYLQLPVDRRALEPPKNIEELQALLSKAIDIADRATQRDLKRIAYGQGLNQDQFWNGMNKAKAFIGKVYDEVMEEI